MADAAETILRDDIHHGGDGADILRGGDGFDLIIGELGQDELYGGGGDDVIIGGKLTGAYDVLTTGLSEEDPSGLVFITTPHPSFFAERLVGGAGDDLMIGGSWNDMNNNNSVDGGELVLGSLNFQDSWGFNNTMWAGEGNDFAYGANGYDTIGGGAGDDFLYGYGGADMIYGGAGDDKIWGGDGEPFLLHRLEGESPSIIETLYGGTGSDDIYGEGGVDRIFGGEGNDFIFGGADDDTLSGGEGADAFSFSEGDGDDVITDFDLAEDMLFFDDVAQQTTVDDFLSQAVEVVVDGQTALLISAPGGGSVTLLGLTIDDLSSVTAHAGPVFTVDM
jgi:Ca2+-binding RTX toxin-like protein